MKDGFVLKKDCMKILVCCHKPCVLPPNPEGIFLPIHVGAAISNVDMDMQRDDQVDGQPCDNISAKNRSYCELTAVYWAWKNIKRLYPDVEYVGLNHYRRFFTKKDHTVGIRFLAFKFSSLLKFVLGKDVPFVFVPNKVVSSSEIEKYTELLKRTVEKNVSVGNKIFCTEDARLNFGNMHDFFSVVGRANIDFLGDIIRKTSPEYFWSFQKTLTSQSFCYANMFIMPYALFCEYCEFVFAVLFAADRDASAQGWYVDIMQERCADRLFGYFGEILTASFFASRSEKEIGRLGTCFVSQ